jgi:hypothetical protein
MSGGTTDEPKHETTPENNKRYRRNEHHMRTAREVDEMNTT